MARSSMERVRRSIDQIERLTWTSDRWFPRGGEFLDRLAVMHAAHGGLRFRRRPIAPLAVKRVGAIGFVDGRSESAMHRWMKDLAVQHMILQGALDVQVEARGFRHRVDVFSASQRFAFECGDAYPDLLYDLLVSGFSGGLIPYSLRNRKAYAERRGPVWFYEFRPNEVTDAIAERMAAA